MIKTIGRMALTLSCVRAIWTMFMRELEDVVREIMEDTRFKGQQHYRFQEKLDPISSNVQGR